MTNTSYKRIRAERDIVFHKADRRGQSKFEAKEQLKKDAIENGTPVPQVRGMFSISTFDDYMKRSNQFIRYVNGLGVDVKHLSDLRQYVVPYLKDGETRWSAWTSTKQGHALATLFECQAKDFGYDFPKRERQNIKRTRSEPESVGNRYTEGEAYRERREFLRATGMRRIEVLRIRKEDIIENDDGTMALSLLGKGGKRRTAPVMPGKEAMVRAVLQQFIDCPPNREKGFIPANWIPDHMATHCYRAQYAMDFYNLYLSQGRGIGKSGDTHTIYYCRKDKAGQWYYKNILLMVSRNMGHNREEVVVSNYFYSGWQPCIPFGSAPTQK